MNLSEYIFQISIKLVRSHLDMWICHCRSYITKLVDFMKDASG